MRQEKSLLYLVITYIPYEYCVLNWFDNEIEAQNFILSDDGYCHDLLFVTNRKVFFENDKGFKL